MNGWYMVRLWVSILQCLFYNEASSLYFSSSQFISWAEWMKSCVHIYFRPSGNECYMMKSWLRNKPGTEMSNSWVVRGFILGAMPAPPEDFFLGRLLPDCRDDKNCPAEQQQPLLTLWHSIEKKIVIRNSLGRHFVGNRIWRKIWRYSKLPPFSWVEKLFSFQFVSVDCCKYILVDTELLIVNQDIRWVKRALKEYNLGSRPLMRPIALLVSGKLYRIQRTLPGSSFQPIIWKSYWVIQKLMGKTGQYFLNALLFTIHHSTLYHSLFVIHFRNRWTDYKIEMRTNVPMFKVKEATVRRRYSDFKVLWRK